MATKTAYKSFRCGPGLSEHFATHHEHFENSENRNGELPIRIRKKPITHIGYSIRFSNIDNGVALPQPDKAIVDPIIIDVRRRFRSERIEILNPPVFSTRSQKEGARLPNSSRQAFRPKFGVSMTEVTFRLPFDRYECVKQIALALEAAYAPMLS